MTSTRQRTLIQGGTVVTAIDTYAADVAIEGESIVGIFAPGYAPPGTYDVTIDAKGKLIFPGGIDVHTHLDMPFGGTTSSDDFETGTLAAAYGGTTSIVDFAIQKKGEALRTGLDTWHGKAEGKAELFTRLLTRRFGPPPAPIAERIAAADSATLDRWSDQLFEAPSLAALFPQH